MIYKKLINIIIITTNYNYYYIRHIDSATLFSKIGEMFIELATQRHCSERDTKSQKERNWKM